MVIWDPSEIAFSIGNFSIRWYALLWCIGLLAAYFLVRQLYRAQQIPREKFEPLFLYCFIGILAGARLGHCLFYEPSYFLSHPIEMFLPVKQTEEGGWNFTGYAGLASHGGTVGLILALWLYVRKYKVHILRVLDTIAIATPITACCIRIGNLMNSEIVGKYTGTDWGFVFVQKYDFYNHCFNYLPRHPAQLYEAIAYFIIFVAGLCLYWKWKEKVGTGFFFGYCLFTIFTFRFFVEYFKEVQETWETAMQATIGLNQGQLLSLPFIIIGLYCLLGGKWCRKWSDHPQYSKNYK